MRLTKPQQVSLLRKWTQRNQRLSFLDFRRSCHFWHTGTGYVCMVEWCGMWLGIEPDGYTHS